MNQEIDLVGQPEGTVVILADAAGARTERRRAVVRDVGHGGVAVADPEADGVATLVGDVNGNDAEALGRVRCRRESRRTATRRGGQKERWGRTAATSCAPATPPRRCRPPGPAGTRHPRVVAIAGPEEGQALHMVPVQVAQQDGAAERQITEQPGRRRRPVPASRSSVGRLPGPSSCDSATQEVCPPKRM